jgi:hypothetical protein
VNGAEIGRDRGRVVDGKGGREGEIEKDEV